MNRLTSCMLVLAAVLVLAPRNAHAQMPVVGSGNLVTPVTATDDGATSSTIAGLRGVFADLRQFKVWFSSVMAPVGNRTPKAAVRARRAPASRTQF